MGPLRAVGPRLVLEMRTGVLAMAWLPWLAAALAREVVFTVDVFVQAPRLVRVLPTKRKGRVAPVRLTPPLVVLAPLLVAMTVGLSVHPADYVGPVVKEVLDENQLLNPLGQRRDVKKLLVGHDKAQEIELGLATSVVQTKLYNHYDKPGTVEKL